MPVNVSAKVLVSSLLIFSVLAGCGGTPAAPDNSREEMENRRDEAFRQLK